MAVELPLGIIVTFHTVASSLHLNFLNYEVMAIMIMFLNMIIALSYPLNFGIYCGMSQQFRETFMKLFGPWIPNMPKCCCQCKRENDSHTSLDAVSIMSNFIHKLYHSTSFIKSIKVCLKWLNKDFDHIMHS